MYLRTSLPRLSDPRPDPWEPSLCPRFLCGDQSGCRSQRKRRKTEPNDRTSDRRRFLFDWEKSPTDLWNKSLD